MSPFAVGDRVMLTCGSLPMTVIAIDLQAATVTVAFACWGSKEGQLDMAISTHTFPAGALVIVKGDRT